MAQRIEERVRERVAAALESEEVQKQIEARLREERAALEQKVTSALCAIYAQDRHRHCGPHMLSHATSSRDRVYASATQQPWCMSSIASCFRSSCCNRFRLKCFWCHDTSAQQSSHLVCVLWAGDTAAGAGEGAAAGEEAAGAGGQAPQAGGAGPDPPGEQTEGCCPACNPERARPQRSGRQTVCT